LIDAIPKLDHVMTEGRQNAIQELKGVFFPRDISILTNVREDKKKPTAFPADGGSTVVRRSCCPPLGRFGHDVRVAIGFASECY
jgi:hypothetical protein